MYYIDESKTIILWNCNDKVKNSCHMGSCTFLQNITWTHFNGISNIFFDAFVCIWNCCCLQMSMISFRPQCMKGNLVSQSGQRQTSFCFSCYAERASQLPYDAMAIRNSFHEGINQPSNSLQDHQMYYLQDEQSLCCHRIPLDLFLIFTGYFCFQKQKLLQIYIVEIIKSLKLQLNIVETIMKIHCCDLFKIILVKVKYVLHEIEMLCLLQFGGIVREIVGAQRWIKCNYLLLPRCNNTIPSSTVSSSFWWNND